MFASSRDIKDLHPRLREIFVRFNAAMIKAGVDFILTCTYRNDFDQQKAFDQGRTTPGHVVTNALPGQSKHNYTGSGGIPSSRAFDIAIMDHGKIDWSRENPKWKIAGRIGKSLGLTWGGDWKSFSEYPHFELKESE